MSRNKLVNSAQITYLNLHFAKTPKSLIIVNECLMEYFVKI